MNKSIFYLLLLTACIAAHAQQAEQTFVITKTKKPEITLTPKLDTLYVATAYNFSFTGIALPEIDSIKFTMGSVQQIGTTTKGAILLKLTTAKQIDTTTIATLSVYGKGVSGNSTLMFHKIFTITPSPVNPVSASPFSVTELPKTGILSLHSFNTGFVDAKKTDTLPLTFITQITSIDYYDPVMFKRLWQRSEVSYQATVIAGGETSTFENKDRILDKPLTDKLKTLKPGDKLTFSKIVYTGYSSSGDIVKQKIKDTYSLTVK
jgi:hypothetical protein